MNSYYVVSYSHWEEYAPKILRGPAVENWQEFCQNLIPLAALRSLEKEENKKYPSWVGWDSIIESLVDILCEDYEYEVVHLPEYNLWGGLIIRDESDINNDVHKKDANILGEAKQKIFDYNKNVENTLDTNINIFEKD